jgi:hypothetical protein
MELKSDNDTIRETGTQLFLVDTLRNPMASTGAIVTTDGTGDEINPGGDIQSSSLVGLMDAQSSSVCFPTKFSKWTLSVWSLV